MAEAPNKHGISMEGAVLVSHSELGDVWVIPPTNARDVDRIQYVRKSTDDGHRQTHSLKDQLAIIIERRGPIYGLEYVWSDSQSGRTFDRKQFQAMFQWCQDHPRPRKKPGTIEMYQVSRFGRPVDENGDPDPEEFKFWLHEFERLGWKPDFVNIRKTGKSYIDDILISLGAEEAIAYTTNLSESVERGKRKGVVERKNFVFGVTPYFAKRVVPVTMEDIPVGHRGPNGGVWLARDESLYPYWQLGAEMILDGHQYEEVLAEFKKRGVPTQTQMMMARNPNMKRKKPGEWTAGTIVRALTCKSLIGIMVYRGEEYEAGWPPLVDVELFKRLCIEVERRRALGQRTVRRDSQAVFRPRCAHCGLNYLARHTEEGVIYTHPHPQKLVEEKRSRILKAGCRTWTLPEKSVEEHFVSLVMEQRGSDAFKDHVKTILANRNLVEAQARRWMDDLLAQQEKLNKDVLTYRNMQAQAAVDEDSEGVDFYRNKIKEARNTLEAIKMDLLVAQKRIDDSARNFDLVDKLIDETKHFRSRWLRADPAEKRELSKVWLASMLIIHKGDRESKARKAGRYALITLHLDPTNPQSVRLASVNELLRKKAGTVNNTSGNYLLTLEVPGCVTHGELADLANAGFATHSAYLVEIPSDYDRLKGPRFGKRKPFDALSPAKQYDRLLERRQIVRALAKGEPLPRGYTKKQAERILAETPDLPVKKPAELRTPRKLLPWGALCSRGQRHRLNVVRKIRQAIAAGRPVHRAPAEVAFLLKTTPDTDPGTKVSES